MTRVALLLALLAFALPSLADAQLRRPSLTLSTGKPLVVRGTAFRPAEAVRVTLYAGETTTVVRVRATRTGTFVATADVTLDRCTALRVVAVGSRGSHAAAHLPLPACMPAASP